MFVAFALFLNRSPKNIVHLSTNCGLAISVSMTASRLFGFVSPRNSCTSAAEGMRPVISRYTRLRNSASVVSGADRIPADAIAAKIVSSMKFLRGKVSGSTVSWTYVRSADTDLEIRSVSLERTVFCAALSNLNSNGLLKNVQFSALTDAVRASVVSASSDRSCGACKA